MISWTCFVSVDSLRDRDAGGSEHFTYGFVERSHQWLFGCLDDSDVDPAPPSDGGHFQRNLLGAQYGERITFEKSRIHRGSVVIDA